MSFVQTLSCSFDEILRFLQYDVLSSKFRNNHQRCSIKKDVPKNVVIFSGKHLCCSFFLIKLQAEDLQLY